MRRPPVAARLFRGQSALPRPSERRLHGQGSEVQGAVRGGLITRDGANAQNRRQAVPFSQGMRACHEGMATRSDRIGRIVAGPRSGLAGGHYISQPAKMLAGWRSGSAKAASAKYKMTLRNLRVGDRDLARAPGLLSDSIRGRQSAVSLESPSGRHSRAMDSEISRRGAEN